MPGYYSLAGGPVAISKRALGTIDTLWPAHSIRREKRIMLAADGGGSNTYQPDALGISKPARLDPTVNLLPMDLFEPQALGGQSPEQTYPA